MVHLFATLPAEKLHGIPSKIVHTSRRLALEWQVSHLTNPYWEDWHWQHRKGRASSMLNRAHFVVV